jgi:ferredoxin
VEPETLATTAPGIFAGGDVAFGPRLIINAVADGRKAARSIHQYLRGNATWRSTVQTREVAIRSSYDTYDAVARHIPKTLPLQRRVGFTEVELPYTREEAESEADRCLQCHKNIFLDGERCILCGGCVDVCPYQCIQMVSASRIEWGPLAEQVSPEACGESGYAMILDETRCIRCGLCVERCPTDAIGMRVFEIQGEWVYD